jgi:hypothetical protein
MPPQQINEHSSSSDDKNGKIAMWQNQTVLLDQTVSWENAKLLLKEIKVKTQNGSFQGKSICKLLSLSLLSKYNK